MKRREIISFFKNLFKEYQELFKINDLNFYTRSFPYNTDTLINLDAFVHNYRPKSYEDCYTIYLQLSQLYKKYCQEQMPYIHHKQNIFSESFSSPLKKILASAYVRKYISISDFDYLRLSYLSLVYQSIERRYCELG